MNSSSIAAMMALTTSATVITLFDIVYGDETYHICAHTTDITYEDVLYHKASITYQAPDTTANDQGAAKVSICTVDQVLPEIVISADEIPTIVAHTVIDTDDDSVEEIAAWEFELQNVTWEGVTMTADLVYESWLDTEIPAMEFDALNFPGCY